jgi:hypothetical protein
VVSILGGFPSRIGRVDPSRFSLQLVSYKGPYLLCDVRRQSSNKVLARCEALSIALA